MTSWPGWVLASAEIRSLFDLMAPVEPELDLEEEIDDLAKQWGIEPWQTALLLSRLRT